MVGVWNETDEMLWSLFEFMMYIWTVSSAYAISQIVMGAWNPSGGCNENMMIKNNNRE